MCGIAGVHIRDLSIIKSHLHLEHFVNRLLLGIEHRGRDATGFVAIAPRDGSPEVKCDKDAVTASEFIVNRERLPQGTQTVLLHTRFQTKGDKKDHANNHPVIHKTCFAVHNGMIGNDDALYKELKYERAGQVDSEIIAAVLGNSEWDNDSLITAMEQFRGALATAVVDPIRAPGKVLLAKGESSPLCILDMGKFVIWSTLREAIKEAWGKTLGTPPADNKFHYFREGMILVISNDPTIRLDYKPKKWSSWTPNQGYFGFGRRINNTDPWDDSDWEEWKNRKSALRPPLGSTSTVTFPSIPMKYLSKIKAGEVVDLVTKLRAEDAGIARLQRRHDADRVTWHICPICKEAVAPEDMTTQNASRRCLDCASAFYELYREIVRSEHEDEEKPKHRLTADQMHDLETWAECDDYVHTESIKGVVIRFGMEYELVEALIFRVDPKAVEETQVEELQAQMIDEYDRLYLHYWGLMEDESVLMDGWKAAISSPQEEKLVEEFSSAVARDEDGATFCDHRCSECGGLCSDGIDTCRACRVLAKRDKGSEERAEADAKFFTVARREGTRCCLGKCKKRATNTISGHDTTIAYCHDHGMYCSVQGCKDDKGNRTMANHTAVDGLKFCHRHARKRKGIRADKQLIEMGYQFDTVKGA